MSVSLYTPSLELLFKSLYKSLCRLLAFKRSDVARYARVSLGPGQTRGNGSNRNEQSALGPQLKVRHFYVSIKMRFEYLYSGLF